jgi:cobalt-precorrin 5A hydrolase/precorrin-3B C17-methyltransferase
MDLEALTPDQVDMLTVVLIGSSQSRALARPDGGHWVYTPRGYAAKRETSDAQPLIHKEGSGQ